MPMPPKRKEARLGHSHGKRDIPEEVEHVIAEIPAPPEASPDWHPTAQSWFRSLKMSPVAEWYTPSDWMTAWVGAELLTAMLDDKFTPGLMAQFNEIGKRLLCTEGDRRHARIELIRAGRDDDEAGAVADLKDWQAKLGA